MYKVVIKNTSWKPNYQKSDFWYLHKISHRFFCNLPLSRNKNDQPGINVISVKYEIRPKIKSMSECMSERLLSASSWLSVMSKMAEFITNLHSQGRTMSFVIEDCTLIFIPE